MQPMQPLQPMQPMQLQEPRPLINERGEITSLVRQQVPMPMHYGTIGTNAFYTGNPLPGMNGPFKFFVNTPAHFLPDPATPAAQPSFQSMGCQAMSPMSMASKTPAGATVPDAFGASPKGLQVPTFRPQVSGSAFTDVSPYVAGDPAQAHLAHVLQVPTFMPQVSGSAFTDVSPYVAGDPEQAHLEHGLQVPTFMPQVSGGSAVHQPGYTSSPVAYPGQLLLSGAPVIVPGPAAAMGGSTPLSPVPAAFMSGHSMPGTPMLVVPHATSDRMGAAAAKVPMARGTEDGTSGTSTPMTTPAKFSTSKSKNKKKEKSNRCMCF